MPKNNPKNKRKNSGKPAHGRNQQLLYITALVLLAIVFVFRTLSITEILADVSSGQTIVGFAACFCMIAGFVGLTVRHIFNYSTQLQKSDKLLFALAAFGGIVLAIMSFNPVLAPNGDNAEYLINAKSLVERGGVYRLDTPNETYNSLAALGLPALLSPVYSLWGFDIVKMKVLILLLYMGILPILYLLFNEFENSERTAAVLSVLGWSSPYLVSASSAIMTETPFIFFSALALLLITRFGRETTWRWRTLVFMLSAIVMTFLVRAIGIGMFGAMILYLMLLTPWASTWQEGKVKALWGKLTFRKLVWLTLPVLVAGLLFQIWQQSRGISQAAIFFNKDILAYVGQNLYSTKMVLGQMIFGEEIYRWFSFDADSSLPSPSILHYLIMLVLLIGIGYGIYRKNPIALYTVLTMLLVIVGSLTPQEMVTMRYNMVLMPYFIYLFYIGFQWLGGSLISKMATKNVSRISQFATFLVLAQLMFAGLSNNLFNVGKATRGYGNAYDDFLQAARWCGENIPEDAFVASAKPRIFYVFSGRKGLRITGQGATYSAEYEQDRLDFFKRLKVSHLILDQASSRTQEAIFPIVDNNVDKFEMLHIPKPHGTCGIVEIKAY